ncbi:MAG: succinylarginine dihydrolase [Phenylobacterium sp.]|jgi:succinylarginine dihydrolase
MTYFEYNCDGLIGPNHNYCGLAYGNVASAANKNSISHPKEAAKQGLAKMKFLSDLGIKQLVLPPHERPSISALRQVGFSGTDEEVLVEAAKTAPELLANVSSASAMWTANAATISPSADSLDGKIHITPANLNDKYHRAIEIDETSNILKATFKDSKYFTHHDALPSVGQFGDEGAANHTRLCTSYGERGIQLFVYGRHGFDLTQVAPKKFPARQTLQASEAVIRSHKLAAENVVLTQQNPDVIDQGVFHNDVIAVGNGNVYFYHQDAFLDTDQMLAQINRHFEPGGFYPVEVPRDQVTVQDAVESYLFNSQLITISEGSMALICPSECENNTNTKRYLDTLVGMDNPINEVIYKDLRQSMRNGGGPACLRLRMVLSSEEEQGINQGSVMNDDLFAKLNNWVDKHYRDEVSPADLGDPVFLREVRAALDELTQILEIGAVYPFQQG